MSDKRERGWNGGRISDEDIDRAARSLVAARPSPQFSARVMRRVREATPPSFVASALQNWRLALAPVVLLLAAGVIWMNLPSSERPATTRVAQAPKLAAPTEPVPAPVAPPAPATASPMAHSPSRGTEKPTAPTERVLARVVGPRLAERFGRTRAPAAPWDVAAPAQPQEATVDVVPDVAPIELPPLPAPSPVIIPPIVIPELTLRPIK